jgi:hypothetical protein
VIGDGQVGQAAVEGSLDQASGLDSESNEPTSGSEGRRSTGRARDRSDLLYQRLLEELEVLEGEAGAHGDAVERFSATWHGTPVTWVSSLSMLRNIEPPPLMTMPLSMMSLDSSGGVFSSTLRRP